jgi:hypothetical protein
MESISLFESISKWALSVTITLPQNFTTFSDWLQTEKPQSFYGVQSTYYPGNGLNISPSIKLFQIP